MIADHDAPVRCAVCGRARPSGDGARRAMRIGMIATGVAIHVAAGALFWKFPPGSSPAAWAVYLGMGIVGFLHIFIGGEMLRRELRETEPPCETRFTAAMLPHPTGEPETLAPDEWRISGMVLIASLIVFSAATSFVLWMLMAQPGSAPGP